MIDVRPANLRDASWITANMQRLDREEIFCQLNDGVTTAQLAEWLILGGDGFIAYLRDEPVMLFGTTPIAASCMSVWAMGTRQTPRVIPAVSRYLIETHIPWRLEQGFNSMEARSLVTHGAAHRWMESMGGVRHGPAFVFGKGGEHFILYRWTVAGYRAIRQSRWAPSVPQEYKS